jgi:hypothetical protein
LARRIDGLRYCNAVNESERSLSIWAAAWRVNTNRRQPQLHFNNSYRSQAQGHFNSGSINGGVRQIERHVEHRVAHRRHHRFGRPIINFGLPYVYEPNYYADDECYVWQPAMTPYGWRYMWMNVCLDD